jgi:5-methylcytosine-specific restriction protein A
MARSVDEWVAKHDDQAIPDKVKLRIFEREGRKCQICGGDIRPGDGTDYHHVPALADGGAHRESQIYPVHRKCHRMVTAKEALARAETRATVKKHYGIKTTKGRPMPGTRASGLKRGFDGVVRKR